MRISPPIALPMLYTNLQIEYQYRAQYPELQTITKSV